MYVWYIIFGSLYDNNNKKFIHPCMRVRACTFICNDFQEIFLFIVFNLLLIYRTYLYGCVRMYVCTCLRTDVHINECFDIVLTHIPVYALYRKSRTVLSLFNHIGRCRHVTVPDTCNWSTDPPAKAFLPQK